MNTVCNDFHSCPQQEVGNEEGEGGYKWERKGETKQTLDVLYRWQAWGTQNLLNETLLRHMSL